MKYALNKIGLNIILKTKSIIKFVDIEKYLLNYNQFKWLLQIEILIKIILKTEKTIHVAKKIKFLILAFLVIVGRFYDAYTTYLYTPDLTYESNIIVKFLGTGWFSVIIFQVLLVMIVVYCLYYYFFRYKTTLPTDNNLTKNEFISYLNFANTTSFYKIFYKTPNNKNLLFASIGYIASMTLIFVSYIVGTSTLFLLISPKYKELYKHGIPTILYCIIGGLAIYFSIRFYQMEYKKYIKSNHFANNIV